MNKKIFWGIMGLLALVVVVAGLVALLAPVPAEADGTQWRSLYLPLVAREFPAKYDDWDIAVGTLPKIFSESTWVFTAFHEKYEVPGRMLFDASQDGHYIAVKVGGVTVLEAGTGKVVLDLPHTPCLGFTQPEFGRYNGREGVWLGQYKRPCGVISPSAEEPEPTIVSNTAASGVGVAASGRYSSTFYYLDGTPSGLDIDGINYGVAGDSSLMLQSTVDGWVPFDTSITTTLGTPLLGFTYDKFWPVGGQGRFGGWNPSGTRLAFVGDDWMNGRPEPPWTVVVKPNGDNWIDHQPIPWFSATNPLTLTSWIWLNDSVLLGAKTNGELWKLEENGSRQWEQVCGAPVDETASFHLADANPTGWILWNAWDGPHDYMLVQKWGSCVHEELWSTEEIVIWGRLNPQAKDLLP